MKNRIDTRERRTPAAMMTLSMLFLTCLSNHCSAQANGQYKIEPLERQGYFEFETETVADATEIQGYKVRPDSPMKFKVEFEKTQLTYLGHVCIFRGKVSYQVGEKAFKPIDWFQGIGVSLSTTPDANQDWSKGIDSEKTFFKQAILKKDGSFVVKFDMRESGRNIDITQSFQIGLTLAEHQFEPDLHTEDVPTEDRVKWNTKTPVIKETVQMISIPASKNISRELRLIDQASQWPNYSDGTKLIRAVNGLQRIGKEKALETLTQYLEAIDPDEFDNHFYGEFETDIVYWIILVLFEPADLMKRNDQFGPLVQFETAKKSWESEQNRRENARLWPLAPIEVVDDIPFMLGGPIGGNGISAAPISVVHWAEKYGALRPKRLNPKTNPIVAAKKLITSRKFKELPERNSDSPYSRVRGQAYAMLAEAPDDWLSDEDIAENWAKIESTAAKATWNPMLQRFTTPKSQ